jgi:beta-ureidopropionase / N-carbamoyl-L-amino-acid hydrolase
MPMIADAAPTSLEEAERLARDLFARLVTISADAPGVTRVAYGAGEIAAFDLMAETSAAWGAERRFDAAGNQFLTLPGADRSRRVVIGSHLDSVPHGGNYDGATGVIMGLCVQQALAATAITPAVDLTVACLRAEESCWFPHSYIGSKSALGRLEPGVPDRVRRVDSGKTLAEHIDAAGFDAEAVRRGKSFLTPETVVAYIEPHIEQAPLLLKSGLPLGIVTGIRGSFRYREIRIWGEYSHSGAMPRMMRRDAGLAAARLIAAMHDYWASAEEAGNDLTVTFGEISTDPAQHSFSKVPGEMRLCLDVRSQEPVALAAAETELLKCCDRIAAETGTRFDLGPRSGSEPAMMSEKLVACACAVACSLDLPTHRMASGAGHDAAVFAQAGVPSLMLFVRNENGSHNPDESMDMKDFDATLALLHCLVLNLVATE